jgi:hypothetical protein
VEYKGKQLSQLGISHQVPCGEAAPLGYAIRRTHCLGPSLAFPKIDILFSRYRLIADQKRQITKPQAADGGPDIFRERRINRGMNIRLEMLFAFALCAIILSACGPAHSWHDVSGRNRSYADALADHEACSDEAMTSDNQLVSGGELAAAVSRVNACMALRGWSKIRD